MTVLIVVFALAGTGAVTFLLHRGVQQREEQLLGERANQAVMVFDSLVDQIEALIVGGSIVAETAGGGLSTFEAVLSEQLETSPLSSAALLDFGGGGPDVVAAAGERRPVLLSGFGGEELARLDEIRASGRLNVVSSVPIDGGRVLGFAGGARAGARFLVYAELVVPDLSASGVDGGSGLQYAFYASAEETPENLVFSNAEVVPLAGRRVELQVSMGGAEPLIVFASARSLVGGLTRATPWIALASGLAAGLLVGLLMRRRRNEALGLVARLEQKNIELDESEERYALAAEGANDGLWDWDLVSGEIYFSPIWKRLLGYEDHELENRYEEWETRLHPDDRERMLALNEAFLAGAGEPFEVEHRLRHRDGSYRWIHGRALCVRDGNGKLLRVTGWNTDITERKRLEAELLRSQKLEAVGRLAGGVAHDFNNLLTVIGGYGQTLVRGLAGDEVRRADAEAIVEAARDASSIAKQLLAFSRQQVAVAELVDVNEFVVEVERMLSRLLGEKIELASVLDAGAGWVLADPGQLKQVLVNLAVNAHDAMPEGGRLEIATGVVELDAGGGAGLGVAPGQYATLAVADTGVGIDGATRERLFEPFFTTKAPGKGTGLGLASVYGIVSGAGGAIDVESEPDRGTTFTIYLPRVEELPGQTRRRDVPAAAEDGHGAGTVLLVEDNQRVLALARRTLADAGYRVIERCGPGEALAFTRTYPGPIDLLLTDVVMPELSGFELAERLLAERPGLSVLYMSGHTDEKLPDGAHALVRKPFELDELTRAVRAALDTGRAQLSAAGGERR